MADPRNLWGELPSLENVPISPAQLFEEQGNLLAQATKNLLRGETVKRAVGNDRFAATLFVVAPLLDGYKYALCRVYYSPIAPYPVTFETVVAKKRSITTDCEDETQLRTKLGELLQSPEVHQVVGSLMRESAASSA